MPINRKQGYKKNCLACGTLASAYLLLSTFMIKKTANSKDLIVSG
jgi:hypothetical protein